MPVWQKLRGTTSSEFALGVGAAGNKTLLADIGVTNLPFIRWNDTLKRWEISGDGLTTYDPYTDWMLECEPPQPTNDYSITRVMGQVTQEAWKRTSDATLIKTIDYTYVSGKVDTEDRKVYATDGLTVIAELLITYIYAGALVTGATRVRVV